MQKTLKYFDKSICLRVSNVLWVNLTWSTCTGSWFSIFNSHFKTISWIHFFYIVWYIFQKFWTMVSNTSKTTIYGSNMWNDNIRPVFQVILVLRSQRDEWIFLSLFINQRHLSCSLFVLLLFLFDYGSSIINPICPGAHCAPFSVFWPLHFNRQDFEAHFIWLFL